MTEVIANPKTNLQNTLTAVKLQNIILPNTDICTTEELFLRLNSKCLLNYEQNRVELKEGGIIKFNTYFNAFSVQKWQEYTSVKTININLYLQGKFQIKLFQVDYFSEKANLVKQTVITTETLDEVSVFQDIKIQGYKGLLYVEIQALKDNCLFGNGYFHTNANLSTEANEKIAIVICTYKREAYVYRNIELLDKYLFIKPDIENKFEIFIIDNGRTLNSILNSKIHLVPNKNTGGSGGYTRGIIEVLERENDFSHIIFMDDDVVIAPEAFERIYNLQRVLNDKSLCIGGSMLKLDRKYIQHENGAIWDNEVVRVKPDLDLRLLKTVLFNEIEEYVNYNGWWLFCFPTKTIDNLNLPYPFFVRGDDIELGIRLKQKNVTLNGICVWHESFESKCSPAPQHYYSIKNEMILSAIHSDTYSSISAIKKILKFSLKEACCYRYKTAHLILQAASDFLNGPDRLRTVDPEKNNLEILRMGEKAIKKLELPFVYVKYEKSIEETETTLHRWLRRITLNGHLLPNFLFHNDNKLSEKGYTIVPMHGYRPINFFRAKKALYYNLSNQEGFVVKVSRWEFLKVFVKIIIICFQLLIKFSRLRQLYRQTLPELTNKDFWKSYLEINKYSNNAN
ncbi:glycosyltransferase family 2 protein [Calothrix sp. NIES-2098]|uniref:glycosyltransferase family 2 protein n=1 Tax=Calothrix sp. NIES-2098 TaxID=1954171 RepID=UPI000B61CB79|nr:family 2 glycosyl transferase [Calothrix sp. NIES-2098]